MQNIMYYMLLFMYHKHNIPTADGLKYSRAPVSADSVSTVYRGLKKNLKTKEINGS
jgi:hypothetical protein